MTSLGLDNPDYPDNPDNPGNPLDPVYGLQLGTSPTRAGGQDEVSLNKLPQTMITKKLNDPSPQTQIAVLGNIWGRGK